VADDTASVLSGMEGLRVTDGAATADHYGRQAALLLLRSVIGDDAHWRARDIGGHPLRRPDGSVGLSKDTCAAYACGCQKSGT
jgi:hypothetical protein